MESGGTKKVRYNVITDEVVKVLTVVRVLTTHVPISLNMFQVCILNYNKDSVLLCHY